MDNQIKILFSIFLWISAQAIESDPSNDPTPLSNQDKEYILECVLENLTSPSFTSFFSDTPPGIKWTLNPDLPPLNPSEFEHRTTLKELQKQWKAEFSDYSIFYKTLETKESSLNLSFDKLIIDELQQRDSDPKANLSFLAEKWKIFKTNKTIDSKFNVEKAYQRLLLKNYLKKGKAILMFYDPLLHQKPPFVIALFVRNEGALLAHYGLFASGVINEN